MKKRSLCISLMLVLILAALAPATALAGNDRGAQTGSFTGYGLLYVTYMPDPIIKGNVWCYQGEGVDGFLAQCDWDLLAGTVFGSEHDSTVRVSDDGSAKGTMKGTFTITRPDGTGTLEGNFTGRITGNLFTGDISDVGTWESTGSTGVFEGVKARGNWSADLSYGPIPGTNIYSLVGPVTWDGKYTSHVKSKNINKPEKVEKPIKPWKPLKPWKPIRPEKP